MRTGTSVRARAPLASADAVGAELVQLHLSAPQQWRDPVPRADADELAASGRVAAVHAPYLVNPASATPRVRERSWHSLQAQLDAAATVGADALVVHAGQAGPDGEITTAVERWLEGIDGLTGEVPLLIENTAAGAAAPGRHLDDLVELVQQLRTHASALAVGVCLDTAPAWAGDPAASVDPAGWVTEVRDRLGGIDLLHVNDCAVEAGAGRDRHEALGEGTMGDALAAMVGAARAPAALLETPGDDAVRAGDLRALAAMAPA